MGGLVGGFSKPEGYGTKMDHAKYGGNIGKVGTPQETFEYLQDSSLWRMEDFTVVRCISYNETNLKSPSKAFICGIKRHIRTY